MAGPSCHPGGGISGMGVITANVMLKDLGLIDDDDFYEMPLFNRSGLKKLDVASWNC